MSKTQRIFVGIDLLPEVKSQVASYISRLRQDFSDIRVGWEREEKLHLTLKFVEDVTDAELEKLIQAVEAAANGVGKFNLKMEGTGVFPNQRKPRILWLGVGGEIEKLSELCESVESKCEDAGFKREERNFHPHLTIARIRQPEKGSSLARAHIANIFGPILVEVSELTIFQSILQPTGSIYKRLCTFQLNSTS